MNEEAAQKVSNSAKDSNNTKDSDSASEFDQKWNLEKFLGKRIPARAEQIGARIRPYLTGVIQLQIADRKKSFVLRWTDTGLKVEEESKVTDADCTIKLKEDDLRGIVEGDINPQIAMLSHKVEVSGRMDLAMYLFNLFVPTEG